MHNQHIIFSIWSNKSWILIWEICGTQRRKQFHRRQLTTTSTIDRWAHKRDRHSRRSINFTFELFLLQYFNNEINWLTSNDDNDIKAATQWFLMRKRAEKRRRNNANERVECNFYDFRFSHDSRSSFICRIQFLWPKISNAQTKIEMLQRRKIIKTVTNSIIQLIENEKMNDSRSCSS